MEETDTEQDDVDGKPGYNKKTQKFVKDYNSDKTMVKLRHFTWSDIEAEVEQTVDTVIMDCEGCWVDLVDTYIDRFRNQVNTIILGILTCIQGNCTMDDKS